MKSVEARGAAGIRMLWQHDPNQPIGTWSEVREDKRGLYVEGKLAKGVAKASEVLELMRSGAIDGLSIGFKPIKAKADTGGNTPYPRGGPLECYQAVSQKFNC